MASDTQAQYRELGAFIVERRIAAAISSQADLAALMGCKQQTVSRWEAGTSRPRPSDIGRLAAALRVREADLRVIARYGESPVAVATFAKPFPLEQLDPETLERFVMDVVRLRAKSDVEVSRAGASGHTQNGLDVLAVYPDGRRESYQCKRVQSFGPADVAKMLKAHTAVADKKTLVLSRVASPQTADALRTAGWDLWDKETLSSMIRTKLSADDQNRLVDIYFRGQRLALLGRPEPGPWLTSDEFFAPFIGRGGTFNHDWDLFGREDELKQISEWLGDPSGSPLLVLAGPAGIGKTRLIKEAMDRFCRQRAGVVVRWLSTSAEWSLESLEALGSGEKILIVDDAHDRETLAGLMHYVTSSENNVRLVAATRVYAEERIRQRAAGVAIENPVTVKLNRLTIEQSIGLAKAALAQQGMDGGAAEHIARHTRDSPLVTLMVASVVGREAIPLEAAKAERTIRDIIKNRFEKVIIGDLGAPADQPMFREILDVLAVVQPFHIDDSALIDLIEKAANVDPSDAERLLRLLLDGGIIFKRGPLYRLMPDLLGDYLIEGRCVGPDDKLSRFAKKLLAVIGPRHLDNAMVNLGRLDWRRRFADDSAKPLLDDLWRSFDDIKEEYDQRLNAIKAVAVFQPEQALAFVERKLRSGISFPALALILQNVAHNFSFIGPVCDLLWDMGFDDGRDTGRHPDHAFRVLSGLVEFGETKPLAYTEAAFDHIFKLVDDPKAWEGANAPLHALKHVLSPEGMTTTSDGRQVTLSPFLIDPKKVKRLRQRLIGKTLELACSADPMIAWTSASFLEHAFRWPMGMMGSKVPKDIRDQYDEEFKGTLKALLELVRAGRIQPVALLAVARSISWHAQFAETDLRTLARNVLRALPSDLMFRLLAATADGYHDLTTGREFDDDWQAKADARLGGLAAELTSTYEHGALLDILEQTLATLDGAGEKAGGSDLVFARVFDGALELSRAAVRRVRANPASRLTGYAAFPLSQLLNGQPKEGRRVIGELLSGGNVMLAAAASRAVCGLNREFEKDDLDLLGQALSSAEPDVAAAGIHALWRWRGTNPRLIIDMAKKVPLQRMSHLADTLLMHMREASGDTLAHLTQQDVMDFLDRLEGIPEHRGHWVQQFLAHASEHYPLELVEFFIRRLERAIDAKSFEFRPVNYGPYIQVALRFGKSSHATAVYARFWSWMANWTGTDEEAFYFRNMIADAFNAMFSGSDGDLADFIAPRVATVSKDQLRLIGRLLRSASPVFVFNHRDLVERLLEQCRAVDRDLHEQVTIDLYASATSGVRSGIVGEPNERDLRDLRRSTEILDQLSRLSPARDLYQFIKEHAEREIERSRREWVHED